MVEKSIVSLSLSTDSQQTFTILTNVFNSLGMKA